MERKRKRHLPIKKPCLYIGLQIAGEHNYRAYTETCKLGSSNSSIEVVDEYKQSSIEESREATSVWSPNLRIMPKRNQKTKSSIATEHNVTTVASSSAYTPDSTPKPLDTTGASTITESENQFETHEARMVKNSYSVPIAQSGSGHIFSTAFQSTFVSLKPLFVNNQASIN